MVDKGPEEWGIKYSQFKKLVAYLKKDNADPALFVQWVNCCCFKSCAHLKASLGRLRIDCSDAHKKLPQEALGKSTVMISRLLGKSFKFRLHTKFFLELQLPKLISLKLIGNSDYLQNGSWSCSCPNSSLMVLGSPVLKQNLLKPTSFHSNKTSRLVWLTSSQPEGHANGSSMVKI